MEKIPIWRRGWRIFTFTLLFPTLFFAQAPQPAQQTPFTVRVSSQLVIQAVSVTDKDGKVLPGLTAENFTLTEDNVPQTISVFEFQKIDDTAQPLPLTAPPKEFAAVLQPAITKITP